MQKHFTFNFFYRKEESNLNLIFSSLDFLEKFLKKVFVGNVEEIYKTERFRGDKIFL